MRPETMTWLSTDQVAAFVELARHGSLRAAAQQLLITEQGVPIASWCSKRGWARSSIANVAARAAPVR